MKRPIKLTNKQKNIIKVVALFLGGIIIGFLAGFLLQPMMFSITDYEDMTYFAYILWIVISLVLLLIFGIIHTAIHEAGHLLMGLLTNYKFISFRIGFVTFSKVDGIFTRYSFRFPGTSGQCIMMPPQMHKRKYPYVLYTIGGFLANALMSTIALLLIIIPELPYQINIVLALFMIEGYIIFLMNAIPMKVNDFANDAYNILLFRKDRNAKFAFYVINRVNGLMSLGMRIKDMPANWFEIQENASYDNQYIVLQTILKADYYFDLHKFDKARAIYEMLLEKPESIIGIYKNEIISEILFYELVDKCREEVIAQYYTEELKKYLELNKNLINKYKLRYAYYCFVNKDFYTAEKELIRFEKAIVNYPIEAEAQAELEAIKYVKLMQTA